MKKLFGLIAALFFSVAAVAANEPFATFLNNAPAATSLTGSELQYCYQGGVSKSCTINLQMAFFNANGSPNVSNATGTLPCANQPAYAGFITVAAGTCTSSLTSAITVPQGGNGLTTAALGDLRYGSGTNTLAALAGNTTTNVEFLSQTGTGTVSAAPVWFTPAQVRSSLGVGLSTDVQVFTSSGTWTAVASNYKTVTVIDCGGGGGGGSGYAESALSGVISGGGGGGGALCTTQILQGSAVTSPQTITIGAGGAGGAGVAVGNAGNNGTSGGNSTFGSLVTAYGGGRGGGGQSAAQSGGGGSAGFASAGASASGTTSGGINASGGSSGNNAAGAAESGPGGISSGSTGVGNPGFGAFTGGGGGGGGVTATVGVAGGAGGPAYAIPGGAGGAIAAVGIAGTNNTSGFQPGSGGGGAGGNASGAGFAGGAGGLGSGGGGGGASVGGTSGAGGAGGAGFIIVLTSF